MSKGKPKEAVVLLIDVGENVNEKDKDGQTFLMKSKLCASTIVERKPPNGVSKTADKIVVWRKSSCFDWITKRCETFEPTSSDKMIKRLLVVLFYLTYNIFSDSKDELGVIIMGSETTSNDLDYPNIAMKDKWLMIPSLNTIRYIDQLTSSRVSGDWLSGLIVAINLLKDETDVKKFTDLKILMFSNLSCPLKSVEEVDHIIESLSFLNINIVAIGPQSDEDDASQNQTEVQRKGVAVLGRILDESGGMMCSFEDAMSLINQPKPSSVKPQAWNCDLKIGSNIYIPITGYKKFAPKTSIKWGKKSVNNTPVVQEFVYFQGDKQVDKADVISSAVYGRTVVPISDEDKTSIKLTTEKCFSLIGFTSRENTPQHMYIGDSAHYIAPRSGMQGASEAITVLVKALMELGMAGIVRKVYHKGASPRIGAIIPVCEHDSYFFYYVPLPYSEDVRLLNLPSSKRVKPSREQLDAVDKLIDDMDLSKYDEDEDPYSKLVNPSEEKERKIIVFKALNPKLPVSDLSDCLSDLLQPQLEILENASDALENIKQLFPLQEVEQKTYRRGAADVFEKNGNDRTVEEDFKPTNLLDTFTNFVQSSVTEVGTIDPEGSFLQLLEDGVPFKKVCEQMQTAIKKLLLTSNGSIGIQKPHSAIKTLREHCIKRDASVFNNFVSAIKDDVVEGNSEFWSFIVKDKLGLISDKESETSTITPEEADLFYVIKTCETQSEENEELEAEDMLDML